MVQNNSTFETQNGKAKSKIVSQIARRPGDDLDRFLGMTMRFVVQEAGDGDAIVSARALEERQAKVEAASLWDRLQPGLEIEGVVRSIQPFGAFVDLGGAQGLLHVSQISSQRVEDPGALLKVGQRVRVRVLRIEQAAGRISLSMRQDTPQKPRRQRPAAASPREAGGGFGTLGDLLGKLSVD